MPPPQKKGIKRKTLAERAGEPLPAAPGAPSSRSLNSVARAPSDAGPYRHSAFSSSVYSSRSNSAASSRNTSNGSLTSSVGSTNQPRLAQFHRPQSAMGAQRVQHSQVHPARPLTSTGTHVIPGNGRILGKRKGKNSFSSALVDCPEQYPETKASSYETQRDHISNWASAQCHATPVREISISTALDSLSLKTCTSKVAPSPNRSLSAAFGGLQISPDTGQNAPIALTPQTPSHIPRRVPNGAIPAETLSPSKSPKKKPSWKFLTRDSNLAVLEFNVEDRVGNMESSVAEFMDNFHGATKESKEMKEMISIYKGVSE
ncbi:MAG: hypothetical protein Q9190_006140 [Brigantiaea leucoxantha]